MKINATIFLFSLFPTTTLATSNGNRKRQNNDPSSNKLDSILLSTGWTPQSGFSHAADSAKMFSAPKTSKKAGSANKKNISVKNNFNGGDFSVNVDCGCSLGSLAHTLEDIPEANVVDGEQYVADLLGTDIGTADEIIWNLCRANFEVSAGNFVKYTPESYVFSKEFFDGGTWLNFDRETTKASSDGSTTQVLKDDAAFINQLYNSQAQSNGIEFPDAMPNFEECQVDAVMCCWIQDRQANDNNGNCETPYDENCVDSDPADNTDICYVDMERDIQSSYVPSGKAVFVDEDEGDTHCHGFAWDQWDESRSTRYRGNNLFYVSFYDHLYQRGYVKSLPGAPMCACTEQMPVVSRSDCTELLVTENIDFTYSANSKSFSVTTTEVNVEYAACQGANGNNNDLQAYYERLVDEGRQPQQNYNILKETIVGDDNCEDAINDFMGSDNPQSQCTNFADFIDSYGDGCEWYEENEEEGCPGWGDCCDIGLGTANEACCHCGGGNVNR